MKMETLQGDFPSRIRGHGSTSLVDRNLDLPARIREEIFGQEEQEGDGRRALAEARRRGAGEEKLTH